MNEKEEHMILTPVYSLLSLNVLCGTWSDPLPIQRFKSQVTKIKHLQPDIVCLQEFNNPTVEYIFRTYLQQHYDFHIHYVSISEMFRRTIICVSIPIFLLWINKYIYYAFMSILFYPYVFNFIIGIQKTGNAIMTHKSIRKQIFNIDCKEFTYQYGDFLNMMRKRGYIDIDIDDIIIRNTHLNHEDNNQNHHQMVECVQLKSPSILVGDFNSQVITPVMTHKFKDITKYLGNTYRQDNKYTKYFTKSKRIDYIFSLDVTVFTAEKLDFDSDHDALFIEFCNDYKCDTNKLHNGTITAKKHHILATDLE